MEEEDEIVEQEDNRKRSFGRKAVLLLISLMVIIFFVFFTRYYKTLYRANVELNGSDSVFVYIPTHADFGKVCEILYNNNYIKDKESFEWLAGKMNYTEKVKPGKYLLMKGMGNKALISLLRSGRQVPVKLTFNNIRTKNELVSKICTQLEADSNELSGLLNYDKHLSLFGLNSKNCLVMFIPNTYEFFWNTSAEQFLEKMNKEYKKFWNEKRNEKLKATGLNKTEASILASIVQAEQMRFNDENNQELQACISTG